MLDPAVLEFRAPSPPASGAEGKQEAEAGSRSSPLRFLPIHKSRASWRTWYWHAGSIHVFRWGFHVVYRLTPAKPRNERVWRQVRLAFFATIRKQPWQGRRIVDFSIRETRTATSKPERACWRFWIAIKIGRTNTRRYDDPDQPPG